MGYTPDKYEILQINASDLIRYNSPALISDAIENYRIADNVFFASEDNLTPFSALVKIVDDNALFNQVLIETKNATAIDALYETIVYVKFDETNLDRAKFLFSSGFNLRFKSGHDVHFVNFEKSNSMSKDCVLSFIDSKYEQNVQKRISLDIDFSNDKYVISKVYAYKGLMLSGGTKIGTTEELGLNYDSVVIVEDEVKSVPCTVVTAVNYPALIKTINKRLGSNSNTQKAENDIRIMLDAFGIFDNFRYDGDKQGLVSKAIDKYLQSTSSPSAESFLNGFLDEQFKCKNPRNAFPVDQQWVRVEMEQQVEVNMFDGEGLILKDFADNVINPMYSEKKGESIKPYSSYQIRLPFVKGMLHSCPFDAFFEELGVTEIEDYLHNKHDVSKVKIILTKSQFKAYSWLKNHCNYNGIDNPAKYYWDKLKKYEHCLFITGVNNPYSGDINLTNYQFLHTPDIKGEDFDKIKARTEKIYFSLKYNADYRRKYLLGENPFLSSDNTDIDESDLQKIDYTKELIRKNPDFVYFPPIASQINDVLAKIKEDYSLGKLFIDAETRYLSGDLLQLLYNVAKKDVPASEQLKRDRFYAPKRKKARAFKAKQDEAGYTFQRNPHLTRNEDVMLKPFLSRNDSVRSKMFGHLVGVVMINPTSLAAERLGGADYDGDIVRIIKNHTYNRCVAKHFDCKDSTDYNNFNCLYHAIIIPHTHAKESVFDNDAKFDTIKSTFSSRTGRINNDAFKYSIFAYNANAQDNDSDAKNAEYFSIMTGLEIDSAKSGAKPKLPFNAQRISFEGQRKYFLQYKDNPDSFNTKSDIVDFVDFDYNKNASVIENKDKKTVKTNGNTQVIAPSQTLPNIMVLPYLKLWMTNPKSYPYDTESLIIADCKNKNLKARAFFDIQNKVCSDNQTIADMLASCIAYFEICKQLNTKKYFRQINTKSQNNVYVKKINQTLLAQNNSQITKIQSVHSLIDALATYDKASLNACVDKMKKANWIFSSPTIRKTLLSEIFEQLDVQSQIDEAQSVLSDFSHDGYMMLFLIISAAKEEIGKNSKKQTNYSNCFASAEDILKSLDLSVYTSTDMTPYKSAFNELFVEKYNSFAAFCTNRLYKGNSEYRTKELLNDQLNTVLLQMFDNPDVEFVSIIANVEKNKAYNLVWKLMPQQVYNNAYEKGEL